jgi:predicted RNA binding protein YcfA (HicA-like mRNA interferase family)
VKISDALKMLKDDDWRLVLIRGGHRQYKHGAKPVRVTAPRKPNDDLAPGTWNTYPQTVWFEVNKLNLLRYP